MSTIVKVQKKGQVTLPTRLRSQAGITDGDLIEATFQRGKIILIPKVVIDRSRLPNDEYTPKQRRIIDARLAKADADIKAGRVSRTFETAEEFITDLHKASAKLNTKKNKPSRR